jgi:hypothetical protein
MIAARIQEEAFGTLDRATLKLLDGLARRDGSRPAERARTPLASAAAAYRRTTTARARSPPRRRPHRQTAAAWSGRLRLSVCRSLGARVRLAGHPIDALAIRLLGAPSPPPQCTAAARETLAKSFAPAPPLPHHRAYGSVHGGCLDRAHHVDIVERRQRRAASFHRRDQGAAGRHNPRYLGHGNAPAAIASPFHTRSVEVMTRSGYSRGRPMN